jgi:hypothetical protein
MTVRHIFEISEDDHPPKFVGHARDIWWTLALIFSVQRKFILKITSPMNSYKMSRFLSHL